MNVIAVTQARIGSTRLPGKILMEAGGISLLEIHLTRVLRAERISKLIVATTFEQGVENIVHIADKRGAEVFQGSIDDVLDRFYNAVKPYNPQYVVRLTSDCPLIDPVLIDKVIDYTALHQLDYCSNTLEEKYPDGQDVEVFTFTALEEAWKKASINSEREHVTPYIRKNATCNGGTIFKAANFNEGVNLGDIRMTVDEIEDLDMVRLLIEQLGIHATMEEYVAYIKNNNQLFEKNNHIIRNEGYLKSLKNDK